MLSPASAGPTIHHEAIDWAKRASANGGAISTNVLRAVSDFCRAANAGSFRSSLYRLNLFCGGNLSGCLVPLYLGPTFGGTSLGSSTDTNANFVSADFIETGTGGGLKGNGTTKYLNTGLAPNALPSVTSIHLSASATSAATTGNYIFIGARDGNASGHFTLNEFSASSNGRSYTCGTITVGQFPSVSSPGSSEPHMIGSRTSATSAVVYRSGVSAASNATSITPTTHANAFYVFGGNLSGGNTGASSATIRAYSIGTGLDSNQAAAFSAAVIAFNSALGR